MWNGMIPDMPCKYVILGSEFSLHGRPSGKILVSVESEALEGIPSNESWKEVPPDNCKADSRYFIDDVGMRVHPYHAPGGPCSKCRHYTGD